MTMDFKMWSDEELIRFQEAMRIEWTKTPAFWETPCLAAGCIIVAGMILRLLAEVPWYDWVVIAGGIGIGWVPGWREWSRTSAKQSFIDATHEIARRKT
jgi:hypothetical protein